VSEAAGTLAAPDTEEGARRDDRSRRQSTAHHGQHRCGSSGCGDHRRAVTGESVEGVWQALKVFDRDLVLLDYTTNSDVCDFSSPLSHAALLRLHVEERWPAEA
jgi:hypothetical protein